MHRGGIVRPRLLLADADVDLQAPASHEGRGLNQDLALEPLLRAMGAGNPTIERIAERVILDPLTDEGAIAHRQAVLRTCLAHPDVVRALFDLTERTLERRRRVYWGLVRRADAIVHHGIELIRVYHDALREMRALAYAHAGEIGPDGLGAFLERVRHTVDDALLDEMAGHVKGLRFRAGVRVSARLGVGNAGADYRLEPPTARRAPLRTTLDMLWSALTRREPAVLTYRVPNHFDAGVRALADLKARGLERTAHAVAEACDDLLWLFRQLHGELAFYVGCVNLAESLDALGAPRCEPGPHPVAAHVRRARGLYDPSLALTLGAAPVGNDVDADGKDLILVTGANQGGKTTFLRGLGTAQLMLQAGMFAPAQAFEASVTTGLFTHFTRREDATMRRGKLDEELARLSATLDQVGPQATLLCNESFASTNEREGSELALGVVRALTESRVRVVFVTHLSGFASACAAAGRAGTLSLRAQRRESGERTFRMVEGAPERTAHAVDLYRDVIERGARVKAS